MVINMVAGGFVLLVLILMFLTRHGQPRRRRVVASDPNFIYYGADSGGTGGDCGSDGGGSCGDGGDGGGGGD